MCGGICSLKMTVSRVFCSLMGSIRKTCLYFSVLVVCASVCLCAPELHDACFATVLHHPVKQTARMHVLCVSELFA